MIDETGEGLLTLALGEPDGGEDVSLAGAELLLGAYTGRDEAAVAKHVAELAAHGVEPPASVPCFYAVPSESLRLAPAALRTASATTSGEAEPVLIRTADGELLLAVGSDHTDREVEKRSVHASKLACEKVLGREAWRLDEALERWDDLVLTAYIDGERLYQRAPLALMRSPLELLELASAHLTDPGGPLVLFLGTVPLLDGEFLFSDRFRAVLRDPRSGHALTCGYEIEVQPTA